MKELDWANLPFGYMKTDYNVRIYYRNEQWGALEVCSEETIPMHMAATCLHYGQEAFEGLKAFRGKDGKVRIFRLEENAARLQSTCRGILMPELPTERFKEAILKVVKLNERFIPPYESGASLYIRPLLVGTGAQVGVHPAKEYLFVVFVTPVVLTSREGSPPIRTLLSANMTVPHLWAQVSTRWAAIMRPACAPIRKRTIWLCLRVLSGCQGKEIHRRVRCCQLLRYQGQYVYHSEIHFYSSVHHQQEPDATGRGYGHESRTPSGSGRRAAYFRGSGRLWHGCRYQSDRAHRRCGER